jgi:hypothetical protein
MAMKIEIGWGHGLQILDKQEVYHEGRRHPAPLVRCSRLIRSCHPDIVLLFCGRVQRKLSPKAQIHPKTLRQKDRRISSLAAETLESGEDCRTPRALLSGAVDTHRWGKSLRYRGQRGEAQDASFTFHPFSVSRTDVNKRL